MFVSQAFGARGKYREEEEEEVKMEVVEVVMAVYLCPVFNPKGE